TSAGNLRTSIGFARYPSKPSSSSPAASSGPSEVSATMGRSDVRGSARRRLATSGPSISGSRTSSRTRSGRCSTACSSAAVPLAAVETERPDVVVTDIRMPPGNTDEGIQAAERLRVSHPEVGVVVLSQYLEPSYALALLERGTSRRAYLLKERVQDLDHLTAA